MKKLIVFLVAVGFLVSCSSTKIMTDMASDADFSIYETVKIEYQENENGQHNINSLNAKRVENALRNETMARGLDEIEEADLKIIWGVDVDFKRSATIHSTHHGYGGYGYEGYGTSYSNIQTHKSAIGIFQITVIDTATNKVIWLGTASDDIKGKFKNQDEKFNWIIAKVLEDFPITKHR